MQHDHILKKLNFGLHPTQNYQKHVTVENRWHHNIILQLCILAKILVHLIQSHSVSILPSKYISRRKYILRNYDQLNLFQFEVLWNYFPAFILEQQNAKDLTWLSSLASLPPLTSDRSFLLIWIYILFVKTTTINCSFFPLKQRKQTKFCSTRRKLDHS